ncbi:MAG: hypothetical protein HKN50_04890 [Gammaproteobacteria bacterium]|nr:hypothetical protein [Gammaproteobacteria bacterium]
MTEYQLHQLLIANRADFDNAIVMVVLVNFLFIVLAMWKSGELPTQSVRRLKVMCLVATTFFTLRAIAGLVRLEFVIREMVQLESNRDLFVSVWQWPTLFFTIGAVVASPLVAMYFLSRAERDY